MKMPYETLLMDQEEMEEAAEFWQHTLRLQDWYLCIEFVRGFDMGTALGHIVVYEEKKIARIQILEPNDYAPAIHPYDMEWVLVHELLHIHLWPLTRDTSGTVIAEEQAINSIADALIKLYRFNRKIVVAPAAGRQYLQS